MLKLSVGFNELTSRAQTVAARFVYTFVASKARTSLGFEPGEASASDQRDAGESSRRNGSRTVPGRGREVEIQESNRSS